MKKRNVDTNLIIEYYKNHSHSSTAKYFNISLYVLSNILKENNILNHSRQDNLRLTYLELYGTETVPEEVYAKRTEKTKLTNLERYGVVNTFLTESARLKCVAETKGNLERVLKIKQTKLERYGDPNYCNIEKIIQTNQKNYGVDFSFQADPIKQKIYESNIKNHGYAYSFQNPEILNKAIKRMKAEDVKEKRRLTNISRYGVSSPLMNDDIKNKLSKTCQEKYGVNWTCLRPEARMKGNNSKPNLLFELLLNENNIKFIREKSLENYSFDFYIEDLGYLIEIDPTETHNSSFGIYDHDPTSKDYHKKKSQIALNNGYYCIHVWDWDDKEKIIQLLKTREKIAARKCILKEVSKEDSSQFINTYHLLNNIKSDIRIGLYYNNDLVSIMTFGKPRYNKNYQYELLRYCSSKNIIGGAEKLFSYFIKTYSPESIISYCDKSKFAGNIYKKLKFISQGDPNPSKHWYNLKTKKHITDNLLRQRGFDQLFGKEYGYYGKGTNNELLMLEHGFVEIYDCGQETFIWKNTI